jgi:hypothetical protein
MTGISRFEPGFGSCLVYGKTIPGIADDDQNPTKRPLSTPKAILSPRIIGKKKG